MTLFDMTGKVAVITGSTRGIGRAIAERMAEHGAKVVISSRKQDVCDEVAKEINDKFGKGTAVAIAANISSKENLQNLVDESNKAFGRIDVLVCNAASNPYYGPLAGISDDQFHKILGNNIVIANSVNLAGHVTIDDWAILEGNVAVQQFIHIGAHSFIAGASLVRKNVPPFVKAAREPLSYVGVNVVGLRRRGYADDAIARIEDIYREIFVRNNNVERAVQNVMQGLPRSPERGIILDFINNSPKGIMRGLAE